MPKKKKNKKKKKSYGSSVSYAEVRREEEPK